MGAVNAVACAEETLSRRAVDLHLTISETAEPPVVEASQPWIDARGRLFAWSCGTQTAGRIEVAGVGVYCFERRSRRVRAFVRPGTASAQIEKLYREVVYPLALQTRGWQTLHASAVETRGGVVGLCGRSGAGKTTLSKAWPELTTVPWCDDALLFRTDQRRPVTRRLEVPAQPTRNLRAVIVLEPVPARPATRDDGPLLERLAPAAALLATLPHALCLDLENPGLARGLFDSYTDLTSICPVYRLRYRQTTEGASAVTRLLADRVSRADATAPAAGRGPREPR